MFLFIVLPLAALATYALGGLDYLRRTLLPPAPSTTGAAVPYVPPFLGGQCTNVTYLITFTQTHPDPNYRFNGTSQTNSRTVVRNENNAQGAITGFGERIESSFFGNTNFPTVKDLNGTRTKNLITGGSDNLGVTYSYSNFVVTRQDGSNIECGNVPNTNPDIPLPSDDGIADSGSPNLDNDEIVEAGIPTLALPPFLNILNAALNAAKNAADALNAIRSVADAIAAIADLLKKLADNADRDEKEKDKKNKEVSRHDFGSIVRDGFLRLYPAAPQGTKKAVFLDLQLLSIPVYYGKYFGRNSPNFYRFKSLGYISFVSPTFGIIETKEIEFSRISFEVPENASGFFYHLGLDGDIFANVSVFYQDNK